MQVPDADTSSVLQLSVLLTKSFVAEFMIGASHPEALKLPEFVNVKVISLLSPPLATEPKALLAGLSATLDCTPVADRDTLTVPPLVQVSDSVADLAPVL